MTRGSRLIDGPADAVWTFLFAHGAGAGMDTPFMNAVAGGLGERGIRVVRFEFPYMTRRRLERGRRPPDRAPVLLAHFAAEADRLGAEQLAIGGKSMGGRMASMLAAEQELGDAVICLGYPFHPPSRPANLRIAHLEALATATLIVQGTRDPFGGVDEVAAYPLSDAITLHWLADGDHGFKPRKASGHTLEGHIEAAVDAVAGFLHENDH